MARFFSATFTRVPLQPTDAFKVKYKNINNPDNLLALWKDRMDKEADITEVMKLPRFQNIGVTGVYKSVNHHNLNFFA